MDKRLRAKLDKWLKEYDALLRSLSINNATPEFPIEDHYYSLVLAVCERAHKKGAVDAPDLVSTARRHSAQIMRESLRARRTRILSEAEVDIFDDTGVMVDRVPAVGDSALTYVEYGTLPQYRGMTEEEVSWLLLSTEQYGDSTVTKIVSGYLEYRDGEPDSLRRKFTVKNLCRVLGISRSQYDRKMRDFREWLEQSNGTQLYADCNLLNAG